MAMLRNLVHVASRSLSLHRASACAYFKTPPTNQHPLRSQCCCYSNSSGSNNNNGSEKDPSKPDTSAKDIKLPNQTDQLESTEKTGQPESNNQSKDDKLAVLKEEIKDVRVADKKKRQGLFDMWAERTIENEPEETKAEAKLMLDQLRKETKQILRYQRDHLGNRVDAIDNSEMVIVGGGIIGMSAAYWLKDKYGGHTDVTVIEKDPSYASSSTTASVGGLRSQFSLPENIRMSMFTAEFFRDMRRYLTVQTCDPPDVQFTPMSYLFLASESGVDIMKKNHETQIENGAKVELLEQAALKERFPFLNVDDVALGSCGLENEGVFDPHLLLCALKTKCLEMGVQFVTGELSQVHTLPIVSHHRGADETERRVKKVTVRCTDNEFYDIYPLILFNCAGAHAGHVGRLAGMGEGEGPFSVPLPVEPRKRFVYVFHCPDGPGLTMPFVIDPSGVYVRREGIGGMYICGASPPPDWGEPDISNMDVDYSFFEEYIWPRIAHRVPAFENLKDYEGGEEEWFYQVVQPRLQYRIPSFKHVQVKSAWSGYYDYNTLDQNLIIGNHPMMKNFYVACGCSGHGIQQGLAIGRSLADLSWDAEDRFQLDRFCLDRVLYNEPVFETNIV